MDDIKQKTGGRQFKRQIRSLLEADEIDRCIDWLRPMPKGRVIHALIALLSDNETSLKWRAVTALGSITAELAEENMEAARTVVRRLMWSLYEESGGIGWGAPEAIGEILACHAGLADEFVHILISFADEEGSYLEFEPLQTGVLWGIARLAQVRPALMRDRDALRYVLPYLNSTNTLVRGMAVWACSILGNEKERPPLEHLIEDHSEFPLYWDRHYQVYSIGDFVKKTMDERSREIN